MWWVAFLSAIKILSLALALDSLTMVCVITALWVLLVWSLLSFLDGQVNVFPSIWGEILAIILHCFFFLPLSPSFLGLPLCVCSYSKWCPMGFWSPVYFFFILSLFFKNCFLHFKFADYSACSYLLLSPSSEFLNFTCTFQLQNLYLDLFLKRIISMSLLIFSGEMLLSCFLLIL